ncbi:MAG: hypothetical protein GYA24_25060, partial [Candidatus Lokiarchaeota archaeon]|nr:hypothetical protein [Candidatus Lokiarchaeota archaeon]
EVEMILEASLDGNPFVMVGRVTMPVNQFTWSIPFDTTRLPDSDNVILRVIAKDKNGMYSAPVIAPASTRIDNHAPTIDGVSLANNTMLVSGTNISITTSSSDAIATLFEFVPHGASWSSPLKRQYLDGDASDGFSHYLPITALAEGAWDLRVILADTRIGNIPITYISGDEVKVTIPTSSWSLVSWTIISNITIMHVTPEITSPIPGTISNGLFTVTAFAGTASVLSASLFTAILANESLSSAATWVLNGVANVSVNSTFWFSFSPATFQNMSCFLGIRVLFLIENGTRDFWVNASTYIYMDTIAPVASVAFNPAMGIDANGYTTTRLVSIDYDLEGTADVAYVQVMAWTPEDEVPREAGRYGGDMDQSGTMTIGYMIVDGGYKYQVLVVDRAGNAWTSAWLEVNLDARPAIIERASPMPGQRVWYNSSLAATAIPLEYFTIDCDIIITSITAAYRFVENGSWIPFDGAWSMSDAHHLRGFLSINTTDIPPYPAIEVWLNASDRSSTTSVVASFILTGVADIVAPHYIAADPSMMDRVWGDFIAVEIEAQDDQSILSCQIWLGAPGSPLSKPGTPGLLATINGTTRFSTIIPAMNDGFWLLHAVVIDHAFNTNETIIPVRVSRSVSCSVRDGSYTRSSDGSVNMSITVSETDLSELMVSIDRRVDGTWVAWKTAFDTTPSIPDSIVVTGMTSGTYRVSVTGILDATCTSVRPVPSWMLSRFPARIFHVDDTAPTNVMLNGVFNYTRVTGAILPMNASAFDDSGIVTYAIIVNGTSRYSLDSSGHAGPAWWIAALPDGEAWLRLVAIDPAGNEQMSPVQQIIVIDNSPPVIEGTLTSPTRNGAGIIIARDAITITFIARETISPITRSWITIDEPGRTSTAWTRVHDSHVINISVTISLAGIAAGAVTMTLHVASAAGTSNVVFQVVHDVAPPAITILSPSAPGYITGPNMTIVARILDDSAISCTAWLGLPGAGGLLLGGLAPIPGTTTYQLTVPITAPRAGTIYLLARDVFGNSQTTSTGQVSLIPETTLEISLRDGQDVGSPVLVSGSIEYAGTTPQFAVGAWYATMDEPDAFMYLGSSSLISAGQGSSVSFEITFDTSQIVAETRSEFIPVSTYSLLEGTQAWSPGDDLTCKLVAFHGSFDTSPGKEIWLVRDRTFTYGQDLVLHVLVPVTVNGVTRYQQSIPFSAHYDRATYPHLESGDGLFRFTDWESGDVDGDGRDEIVLLDSRGRVHVVGNDPAGYSWYISAPVSIKPTRVVIDPVTRELLLAGHDGLPGIWRATWAAGQVTLTGNFVHGSSSPSEIVTALAHGPLIAGGGSGTIFGTTNALGYVDAAKNVHIIESGFIVQAVGVGLIDDDTRYEIVAGVDVGSKSALISFSWVPDGNGVRWTSALVHRFSTLVSMTSTTISPGLAGMGDDITIATLTGVKNYRLLAGASETVVTVQDPAQYTTTSSSVVNGRASMVTMQLDPFTSVEGTDSLHFTSKAGTALLEDIPGVNTVVINEIGFARSSVGGPEFGVWYGTTNHRHNFIELYNYGALPVYIGGMTLYTNPVFASDGTVSYHQGKYVIPHSAPGYRGHVPFYGYIEPYSFVVIMDMPPGDDVYDGLGYASLSTPVLLVDQYYPPINQNLPGIGSSGETYNLLSYWGYSPAFKYLDQNGVVTVGVTWTGLKDFRLWFDLDQFRCGTWFDDTDLVENYIADRYQVEITPQGTIRYLDLLPSSIYRNKPADTNKESDWIIERGQITYATVNTESNYCVSNQLTLGQLNPGQAGTWTGRNSPNTYVPGPAGLIAWGNLYDWQIGATWQDGSIVQARLSPDPILSPLASSYPQHSYSGTIDEPGNGYTSTSLLQTGTFNSPGSSLGTGYPMDVPTLGSPAWSGSPLYLSDNDGTTGITASTSYSRNPERYFLQESTDPTATFWISDVAKYYLVTPLWTPSGWAGLRTPITTTVSLDANRFPAMGGGSVVDIDDQSADEDAEFAMTYLPVGDGKQAWPLDGEAGVYRNHGFDGKVVLDFKLNERASYPSGTLLKLHLKAFALTRAKYYTTNPRYVVVATPITVGWSETMIIGQTLSGPQFLSSTTFNPALDPGFKAPPADYAWGAWSSNQARGFDATRQYLGSVYDAEAAAGKIHLSWSLRDTDFCQGNMYRWYEGAMYWNDQGVLCKEGFPSAYEPTLINTGAFSFIDSVLLIEEAYIDVVTPSDHLAQIGTDYALVTPHIGAVDIPSSKPTNWQIWYGGTVEDTYTIGFPKFPSITPYDVLGQTYSTKYAPVGAFNGYMFDQDSDGTPPDGILPRTTGGKFKIGAYALEWTAWNARRVVQCQVFTGTGWSDWATLPAASSAGMPGYHVDDGGRLRVVITANLQCGLDFSGATRIRFRLAYLLPRGLVDGTLDLYPYTGTLSRWDKDSALRVAGIQHEQQWNSLLARMTCTVTDLEIKGLGTGMMFDTKHEMVLDVSPIGFLGGKNAPFSSWAEVQSVTTMYLTFKHDELFQVVDYSTGNIVSSSIDQLLGSGVSRLGYTLTGYVYDFVAREWLSLGSISGAYDSHLSSSSDPFSLVEGWMVPVGDYKQRIFTPGPLVDAPLTMRIKIGITFHLNNNQQIEIFNSHASTIQGNWRRTIKSTFSVQDITIKATLAGAPASARGIKEKPPYVVKEPFAWIDLGLWPRYTWAPYPYPCPGRVGVPFALWPVRAATMDEMLPHARASANIRIDVNGGNILGSQGLVLNELKLDGAGIWVEISNYGSTITTAGLKLEIWSTSWSIRRDLNDVFGASILAGAIMTRLVPLPAPTSLNAIDVSIVDSRGGSIIDSFAGASAPRATSLIIARAWDGPTTHVFTGTRVARCRDVDTNSENDWADLGPDMETPNGANRVWGTRFQQNGVLDVDLSHLEDTEMVATTTWTVAAKVGFIGMSPSEIGLFSPSSVLQLRMTGLSPTGPIDMPFVTTSSITFTGGSPVPSTFPRGASQAFTPSRRFIDALTIKTRMVAGTYKPYKVLIHVSKGTAAPTFATAKADYLASKNALLITYDAFVRYPAGNWDVYDDTTIDMRGMHVELDIGQPHRIQFFPVDGNLNLMSDLSLDIAAVDVTTNTGAASYDAVSNSWIAIEPATSLWMRIDTSDRGYWYIPVLALQAITSRIPSLTAPSVSESYPPAQATWYTIPVPSALLPITMHEFFSTTSDKNWQTGFSYDFKLDADLMDAVWMGNNKMSYMWLSVLMDMDVRFDIKAKQPGSATVVPTIIHTSSIPVDADANLLVLDVDGTFDVRYWRDNSRIPSVSNTYIKQVASWSTGSATRVAQTFVVPAGAATLSAFTMWINEMEGGLADSRVFLNLFATDVLGKPAGPPLIARVDVTRYFHGAIPGIVRMSELNLPILLQQGRRVAIALELEDGLSLAIASAATSPFDGAVFQVAGTPSWLAVPAIASWRFEAEFSSTISMSSSEPGALDAFLAGNGGGTKSLVQAFNRETGTWQNMITAAASSSSPGIEYMAATGSTSLSFFLELPDISAFRSTDGKIDVRIILDYTHLASTVLADPTITGYMVLASARRLTARTMAGLSTRPASMTTTRVTSSTFSIPIEASISLADIDSVSLSHVGIDRLTIKDMTGAILAANVVVPRAGTVSLFDGRLFISSDGGMPAFAREDGSVVEKLDFTTGVAEYISADRMVRGIIVSTLTITSTLNMPVMLEHSYEISSIFAILRASRFSEDLVSSRAGVKNVQWAELTGDANADILLDDGYLAQASANDRVYRIKIQVYSGDPACPAMLGTPLIRDVYVCAEAPVPRIIINTGSVVDEAIEFASTATNAAAWRLTLPASAPRTSSVLVEFDVYFTLQSTDVRKLLVKFLNQFGITMFTLRLWLDSATVGYGSSILVNEQDVGRTAAMQASIAGNTWAHVSALVTSPASAVISTGTGFLHVTQQEACLTSPIAALQFEAIGEGNRVFVDNIATSWTGPVETATYPAPTGSSLLPISSAWRPVPGSLAISARLGHPAMDSAAIEIDGTGSCPIGVYDRNIHVSSVALHLSSDDGATWTTLGSTTSGVNGFYSINADMTGVAPGFYLLRALSTAVYTDTSVSGHVTIPIHVDASAPAIDLAMPALLGKTTHALVDEATQQYLVSRAAWYTVSTSDAAGGRVASIQVSIAPGAGGDPLAVLVLPVHAMSTRSFSLDPFWASHPLVSSVVMSITATDAAGFTSLPRVARLVLDTSLSTTIPGSLSLSYGQSISGSIGDSFGLGAGNRQVDLHVDGLFLASAMTDDLGHFSVPFTSLDVITASLLDPSLIQISDDCGWLVGERTMPGFGAPGTTRTQPIILADRTFSASSTMSILASIGGKVRDEDERLKNVQVIGGALMQGTGVEQYEGMIVDLLVPDVFNYALLSTTFDEVTITFTMSDGKEYKHVLDRDALFAYFGSSTHAGAVSTMIGSQRFKIIRVPIPFALLQLSNMDTALALSSNPGAFDPAKLSSMRVAGTSARLYPFATQDDTTLMQAIGIAGVYFADVMFGATTWRASDVDGDPTRTHVITCIDPSTGAVTSTSTLSLVRLASTVNVASWEGSVAHSIQYSDYIMVDGLSITTSA